VITDLGFFHDRVCAGAPSLSYFALSTRTMSPDRAAGPHHIECMAIPGRAALPQAWHAGYPEAIAGAKARLNTSPRAPHRDDRMAPGGTNPADPSNREDGPAKLNVRSPSRGDN